jgi:hypothetical protein
VGLLDPDGEPVEVEAREEPEDPEAPDPAEDPIPPVVVDVEDSSAVSWAWACRRAASASVTAACKGVWSIVASC